MFFGDKHREDTCAWFGPTAEHTAENSDIKRIAQGWQVHKRVSKMYFQYREYRKPVNLFIHLRLWLVSVLDPFKEKKEHENDFIVECARMMARNGNSPADIEDALRRMLDDKGAEGIEGHNPGDEVVLWGDVQSNTFWIDAEDLYKTRGRGGKLN